MAARGLEFANLVVSHPMMMLARYKSLIISLAICKTKWENSWLNQIFKQKISPQMTKILQVYYENPRLSMLAA